MKLTARNLTSWMVMLAYLIQVLTLAQGGILCFGSNTETVGASSHEHPVATSHCHTHLAGASHDHGRSYGPGHDLADASAIEPHHCSCAHMHVNAEIGRVTGRTQTADVKAPVVIHPSVALPQTCPLRSPVVQANLVRHKLQFIQPSAQIVRSIVLLI